MKNQKGITLIALVITIIVLLILAGISIAMITGSDGIITRSRQAKADNEIGAAKDMVTLIATEALAQYFEDTYVTSDTTAAYSGTALQTAMVTAIQGATNKVLPVVLTSATNGVTLTYNERTTTGTVDTDGKLTWVAITDAE